MYQEKRGYETGESTATRLNKQIPYTSTFKVMIKGLASMKERAIDQGQRKARLADVSTRVQQRIESEREARLADMSTKSPAKVDYLKRIWRVT